MEHFKRAGIHRKKPIGVLRHKNWNKKKSMNRMPLNFFKCANITIIIENHCCHAALFSRAEFVRQNRQRSLCNRHIAVTIAKKLMDFIKILCDSRLAKTPCWTDYGIRYVIQKEHKWSCKLNKYLK